MRIKTNEGFAERPKSVKKEKPKYFLIYEGSNTEPKYFEGIMNNKGKLAISEQISIVSVLRSLEDLRNSHPKFALKIAQDIKNQSNNNSIDKNNFLKFIKDSILLSNYKDKNNLINIATDYIKNYGNDNISFSEIDNLVIDIYKDSVFDSIVKDVLDYFNFQKNLLDYNEKTDVINLIVDRDRSSFKDYQYKNLVLSCKEEGIYLYVSNPCFEVWLLMHFDEFDKLDQKKLLENKRVSGRNSKKYTDKMLSNIIGYDKSNLKFSSFVDKVDDAIKREKNYCEDLDKLENNVGSNVGLLIEKLKSKF